MRNPVSGGNAWDTIRAVPAILPGGAQHEHYRQWLDRFADYVNGLRAPVLVPVIFRPFHETSGGWFWGGARQATPTESRRLWRFTVGYLRNRRSVPNLLWAIPTEVSASRRRSRRRIPG